MKEDEAFEEADKAVRRRSARRKEICEDSARVTSDQRSETSQERRGVGHVGVLWPVADGDAVVRGVDVLLTELLTGSSSWACSRAKTSGGSSGR